MEKKLVYVIQTDIDMENRYATLDKEVAKQIIKNEILENAEVDIPTEKIEKFAQDLVDGNTEEHYSDEFMEADVFIWCERMVLQE